jgi:LacI family transcriptional regulator
MGQDLSFCRGVIRGIRAYALARRTWAFRNGPPGLQIIPYLREWKPHGIIANLFDQQVASELMRLRRPLVDTACVLPAVRLPTVDVDHEAVGRMAAEHFLERNFRNFAFFGSGSSHYACTREESFRKCLAEAGHTVYSCHGEYLHHVPTMTGWKRMDQDVRRWLQELPKPVAILASNDVPARNLCDLCSQLGFQIPDQVAVLGVDDDDLECALASPPLSSIALPAERIGNEAARLLDRIMAGENVPKEPLFLPPLRVVARQSTDTMAITDKMVVDALQFIRRHATENINVYTVVLETASGRRDLERRFRKTLGRSILDEIRAMRVERAKELLLNTHLAMPAVAKRAGFSNAQRLAIVFRRTTGISPTTYRRQVLARSLVDP